MLESIKAVSSSSLDHLSITTRDSDSSYAMASKYFPPASLLASRRTSVLTNRDLELTGSKEGKEVMITASDSMEDRFDPKVRRSIDLVVANI